MGGDLVHSVTWGDIPSDVLQNTMVPWQAASDGVDFGWGLRVLTIAVMAGSG